MNNLDNFGQWLAEKLFGDWTTHVSWAVMKGIGVYLIIILLITILSRL